MQNRAAFLRLLAALTALGALAACGQDPVATQRGGPHDASPAVDAQVLDSSVDLPLPAPPTPPDDQDATPVLLDLTPDHGPVGGLGTITIHGQHLERATLVRFGQSPALDLQVIDAETLIVTVPPRPAGLVEVTVRSDGRPDAVQPDGYRYVAQVAVQAVQPTFGPSSGGTALTVTGTGFSAETRFVVGNRLALQPLVLDEHTAAFLAPPGIVGPAPIAAVSPDGTGMLAGAYTYREAPGLDRVEPALGPLTGGGVVHLYGHGLMATGAQVVLKRPGISVPCMPLAQTAGGLDLTVAVPSAVVAGTYDVTYANAEGVAVLPAAYTYVDQTLAQGSLQISSVAPASRPVNALQPVVLGLQGTLATKNLAIAQVRFGGKLADLQWSALEPSGAGLGATLRVLPPAPDDGPLPKVVDVTVDLGAGAQALLPAAFTYLPAIPKITAWAPTVLQAAGGTPVTLQVAPLAPGQKVLGVRIGAQWATQVQATPSGAIGALAPAGSPGPADVEVLLSGGQSALLKGAAQFQTDGAFLAAVVPAIGAQAGGLQVDLIGSGLQGLTLVAFDGAAAHDLQILDSGHARVRTPRGNPGPAAVRVWFQDGSQQTLPNGYTYFDPSAGDTATWGGPIDGAVNVTVLAKGKIAKAVPGALVTSGDLHGITDDRGQITLSAPGLHGPLHVHAAKAGFTAGSVVALGVQNVTIRLQELPKPDSGNGNGGGTGEPYDDMHGEVTGTVLNAEKYTILPPGSCTSPAASGQCQPCLDASSCATGQTCDALVTPGLVSALTADQDVGPTDDATATTARFCLQGCGDGAACSEGFECRVIGSTYQTGQPRCVPRIGTPQTRCESASPSIFGGAYPAGSGGIVDAAHHFHILSTPGDVAIVCRSGYVDAATGQFVPLAIGLARHVAVPPKGVATGANVSITASLDRRVRVRMDRLPVGPDTIGGMRTLTAGIDLGAEGYIPTGSVTTTAVTDVLEFEHQPGSSLFSGSNADLRYELYGGLGNKYGGPPSSTANAGGLDVNGLDRHAIWSPGSSGPVEGNQAVGTLHALAHGGDLRVAVGDAGRILQWTGGGFTVQASPTNRDLFAVWLTPLGDDGWAAGQDGVLVRRGALGWKLWTAALGADVVALAGRAANDVWAADTFAQLHHWNGKAWQDVPGPWPASQATPPPYPTAGKPARKLHGLWQAPTGALFLVGDEGMLVRGDPDGAGGLTFTNVATNTSAALHAVTGSSETDLWIAGDRGFLGHVTAGKVTKLATGTDRPLYGIASLTGGYPLHAVGAQGSWLRIDGPTQVQDHTMPGLHVDLRGVLPGYDASVIAAGEPVLVLGPYLELPYLVAPQDSKPLGLQVQWQAAPGVTPTLNIVRIADSQYLTRWELFVRGNVTQVALPDFLKLGQFNPLPDGPLLLRVWRVYAPGLDVDHFDSKSLAQYTWTSWAYTVVQTSLQAQVVPIPIDPLPPAFDPGK